jgi:catechol 2,3-dioxygenase-like lactoylglutathione lyase family enzyme
MESRISMISLGVHDLPRSVRFYRYGLKFIPSSASNESIVFFKMGSTVLALYPWGKLAEDAQVSDEGHGFRGVTLAHNVRRKEEVSEVLVLAAASGGKIIKPAQDVFWGGHSGYFADPDGHLWEVCWNPLFPLSDDGTVLIP